MNDQLTDAFADYQTGRGFSPATVRRRAVTVRAFARFVHPGTLGDATSALVEEFVHSYRTPSTRRAYLADLRAFYGWAYRRGLVHADPTKRVDSIRVPRGLPRPVPADLVALLIAAAPDDDVAYGVALAAYAGLRLAEIASLDRGDLALCSVPPVLIVRHGKGGKDRVVPVHPVLARMLARVRSGPIISVRAASLGVKIAKHLRAQGVNATAHQLRHTFGTEAARASNGNLLVVADMMGHASLSTTATYTKLVGVSTSATVAAMYPPAA